METIYADDLERVAETRIDKKWVLNRSARGLWLTPTLPVDRGKRATFRFEHALEVALIGYMRDGGLTLEAANQVIEKRMEDCKPAALLSSLPEFRPPFSDHWFWVVEWQLRTPGADVAVEATRAVKSISLVEAVRDRHFVSVLDVSQAVHRVQAILAE
jgi:hypothetical protein